MNLFRSEEHVKRWSLHFQGADDYVMPVADWGEVFKASLFRNRLDPDFLSHADDYVEDYRQALRSMGRTVPAPDRILATILFTDILDSTDQAARAGDAGWRALLDQHNELIRAQLERYGGVERKQTGDGFMASFDSPARAIRCATAVSQGMMALGLEIRAGIHTGECEVFGDDLGGIAVHIGARVEAAAGAGEVLVSRTVKEAVTGSEISFEARGTHQLKGVPGEWELFAVAG